MDALTIVQRQLDGLINQDTYIAFQFASKKNRKKTAPPGYNFKAFDFMVRASFSPLLTATDYRIVETAEAGHVVVILYVQEKAFKSYRFELSRQNEDDLNPVLGNGKVNASQQPWRTDAVEPLPDESLDKWCRIAHEQRQQKLRQRCFGKAAKHPSISHSFGSDRTHNLCCALGQKSKEYSDKHGNPIGQAASKIDFDGDLSSSNWSTCLGSNVCGFLGKRHGDTKALFAVSPDLSRLALYLPTASPDCEAYAAHLLDTHSHGTPGIETQGNPQKCEEKIQRAIKEQILHKHSDIDKFLSTNSLKEVRKGVCVVREDMRHGVKGIVHFIEHFENKIKIFGTVTGLTPKRKYVLNVHEFGDVTRGCSSSGEQLNPYGTTLFNSNSKTHRSIESGTIAADSQGTAQIYLTDDTIRLSPGLRCIIGRTLSIYSTSISPGSSTCDDKGIRCAETCMGCGVIGVADTFAEKHRRL